MTKKILCSALLVLSAFTVNAKKGQCGPNAFWELKGTTLTITGTGTMGGSNYDFSFRNRIEYGGKPVQVVIGEGITNVPKFMFSWLPNIVSVSVPGTVTRIEDIAFSGCRDLRTVSLQEGLSYIGEQAFNECTSLEELDVPNSVTSLGCDMLYGCSSLHALTLPDRMVTIVGEKSEIVNGDVRQTKNTRYKYFEPGTILFAEPLGLEFLQGNSTAPFSNVEVKDHSGHFPSYVAARLKQDYASGRWDRDLYADYPELKDQGEPTVEYAQEETAPAPVAPVAQNDDVDTRIPTSGRKASNTFAVIIGNENYQRVARVPYAANDAKVFAAYCRQTLGLPQDNIRSYSDATFGTLLAALKDIQSIAQAYQGDLDVIFYYAGHGVPSETDRSAYLLPVDADGSQPEACLSTKRLYDTLGALGARKVVVLMDACFSGAQRGSGMLAAARGVALKVREDTPRGNLVVFTAATGDQTAYPYQEKGHGMFTYFLLKKLQDTKGSATLGDLCDYVSQQVARRSVVVNKRSQTPTVTPATTLAASWRDMTLF